MDNVTYWKDGSVVTDKQSIYYKTTNDALDAYNSLLSANPDAEIQWGGASLGLSAFVAIKE